MEPEAAVFARYAGTESCRDCHTNAFAGWRESNHRYAERPPTDALEGPAFEPGRTFRHGRQETEVRREGTNLLVVATGLGGDRTPRRVERVIGHAPLRQYLVSEPGGRWQTLEASWDPRTNEWFNVYGEEDRQPGEWGHWTGRGMNWNSMCGTCHNTRFRKNYDEAADGYRSAMAEPSVGCEACHGPLGEHVSWQRAWQGSGRKDPTLPAWTPARKMENCAPCHARRSELTGDFVPGESFWDHYLLAMVDESDVFYPDGQIRDEDYEYTAFLGSRMHGAGVTCLDCHDPHTTKVRATGNDLCLRCHNGTRPGSPPIDPVRHSFHKAESAGNLCVNCHMPRTLYMQRHWRHDHGFTTPDPVLTREFGIPNACNRCHADQTTAWAEEACGKWYGSRMDRPARRRARLLASARREDATSVPGLTELLNSDEAPYWKAAALALLGRWTDRPAVRQAALSQLSHAHPLVRYRAVQALAPLVELGDRDLEVRLRALLGDAARSVRYTAGWALRRDLELSGLAGREVLHALALNADQPVGQAQLGAFELGRGQVASALAHYDRAVTGDGGSPALRHDYAVALSGAGRSAEALAQVQAAVTLEPGSAENHHRLGLAYAEVNRIADAASSLREAVRLDARHDRAWYNLGLAEAALEHLAEAATALGMAEGLQPRDPRIPYALATVLARGGRVAEARGAAERALRLEPGHAEARALIRQLGGG